MISFQSDDITGIIKMPLCALCLSPLRQVLQNKDRSGPPPASPRGGVEAGELAAGGGLCSQLLGGQVALPLRASVSPSHKGWAVFKIHCLFPIKYMELKLTGRLTRPMEFAPQVSLLYVHLTWMLRSRIFPLA